jgi:beta-lactamase class A
VRRRDFILSALAGLAFPAAACGGFSRAPSASGPSPWTRRLGEIEARVGGRLGVVAEDTGTGRRLTWRPDERFALCSTFKWLLAAQVLARVDRGEERLDRAVPFGPADLLDYAPVAREHVDEGALSVEALCAAIVRVSDNTAANLLLADVGGPAGFTAYLRGIGDPVTRLDRTEPELYTAIAGDPRDTTTPSAMASDLRRVLLGPGLSDPSRRRLLDWLVDSRTGAAKLRAGLPDEWRVGDKTGMGLNGATNDVAIVWPGRDAPVLVAAYLAETTAPVAARNGALADVGRVVADWVAAGE